MTRLRLFVYGSLKRGFANHDRYCRGVCSMEEAAIEGRLFQMPTGYPVLRIPESRVLARGSGDFSADVKLPERFAGDLADTAGRTGRPGTSCVHGVLLTFGNPIDRLRAIDDLEEFRPGERSRYDRVLIAVWSRLGQREQPVWTYVAGDLSPRGSLIPTGTWPARQF